MKYYFPNQNGYKQINRSDRLGSIWSSFNLDFQKKLGTLKLANKLVSLSTSSDDAVLGLPVAFQFWYNKWWAICGTRIFKSATNSITSEFTEDVTAYEIGDSTSQFDISNPSGTTFRYTWDGTGTDPKITALSCPVGAKVYIGNTGFNTVNKNKSNVAIIGSGDNYFEITNATGLAEVDKTIGSGYIQIYGGTFANDYSTLSSDLCIFKDYLFTSKNDGIYYRSLYANNIHGGDFSFRRLHILTSDNSHQMCYFKKRNRLYFLRTADEIGSTDENLTVATTGDYSLNLTKTVGTVRCMTANSQYVWIGSIRNTGANDGSTSGSDGVISQWDGLSNQVLNEFPVKTGGVLSICVVDDVPYALDTSGRILQYTGYSFKEIARFPIDNISLNGVSTLLPTNGFPVHFNGMTGTKNSTILISINNLLEDGTITENMPSGIWELDLSNGSLTHKYSPTLKDYDTSTTTDFGQNRILSSGAIKENTFSDYTSTGKSELLAGFNYYTTATVSKSGIFIDSPKDGTTDYEAKKRGYFVTTWLESNEIVSTWNRLWATFKKFLTSTDKMIFKYRLDDVEPIEATITWTSTTTFTTTTDISAYVGYEAEIIQGTGSGACANILTITEDTGTYTATIDTAITGVTGTAKARFQKWIKLGEITGQVLSYGQLPITQANTRIQIKGILEWTGDNELHKMILVDTDNIKINP